MAVIEHDESDKSQDSTKYGQEKASVLAAKVVEELCSKKRCDSTERVSYQSLTSNSR